MSEVSGLSVFFKLVAVVICDLLLLISTSSEKLQLLMAYVQGEWTIRSQFSHSGVFTVSF